GGLEVKEVANLLFRSSATIRNHMQSIYEKLQVRNRSELSIKMMERLNRVKFTLDLSPIVRASVSFFYYVYSHYRFTTNKAR
ncbi:response regulator transcription factor, partial [Bacteroides finegoldii]